MAAVEALLAAGASLEAASRRNGATPLHLAAYQGHDDVAEKLLVKGAKVDAKDKVGHLWLNLAKKSLGDPSVLALLRLAAY